MYVSYSNVVFLTVFLPVYLCLSLRYHASLDFFLQAWNYFLFVMSIKCITCSTNRENKICRFGNRLNVKRHTELILIPIFVFSNLKKKCSTVMFFHNAGNPHNSTKGKIYFVLSEYSRMSSTIIRDYFDLWWHKIRQRHVSALAFYLKV
jgi:hypothetical protein